MSGKLEGKIALITGASRGIGAAVALRYAKEGAHVILVARTVGGLEELDDQIKAVGGQATLVPMDLLKADMIDALGGTIAQRFGRLDILVGNAGMLGNLGPVPHADPVVWDKTIALNLTANYRLIRSFDPLLRASKQGRAIFVTSGAASNNTAYWGPYAASKAGLEALIKTYAAEVEKTPIRVNLVDPGMVGTKMLAEALPGRNMDAFPKPDSVTEVFLRLALPECTETGNVIHVTKWAA